MQFPLQITLHHMAYSEALEACIRAQATGLERVDPGITRCRVGVTGLDEHGRYAVSVELRVPGHGEIVTREHEEDVYVALRDAIEAAARQVEGLTRDEHRGPTTDVAYASPASQHS